MQIKNWNDLTYLLAIKRGGSYAEAAKLLQVDDTTVSRRLASLQKELDTQLFIRTPNGSIQMTESGHSILDHLDSIENSVNLIEETLSEVKVECTGTVRITSVPIVVNRLLATNVHALSKAHPKLSIVLIPDGRDLSLSHREADIAIRLARPKVGGNYVKARKIGQLTYSVYVAKDALDSEITNLGWVTYDDAFAHIPPSIWTNKIIADLPNECAPLKVHDAETALQATLTGSFIALLPDIVAAKEQNLRRLSVEYDNPSPIRELWLLGHAEQSRQRRIVATMEWIEQTISSQLGA